MNEIPRFTKNVSLLSGMAEKPYEYRLSLRIPWRIYRWLRIESYNQNRTLSNLVCTKLGYPEFNGSYRPKKEDNFYTAIGDMRKEKFTSIRMPFKLYLQLNEMAVSEKLPLNKVINMMLLKEMPESFNITEDNKISLK